MLRCVELNMYPGEQADSSDLLPHNHLLHLHTYPHSNYEYKKVRETISSYHSYKQE